jgi:hypothetical protein
LAGGIVAAALGYGAYEYGPLAKNRAEAEARIAALEANVAALTSAQSAFEARLKPLEVSPDVKALEDRLTKLEARPTAQVASSDPGALAALRSDVEALKAQGSGIISPEVQAQLDAQVKATADKLAQIEAQARETAALGLRQASLRRVAAALETGSPFAAAAADIGDLPPALADHAATGIASLPALQQSFPEAARAALEASLKADMGATWSERVRNFLRASTGARALTPQEGDDPDAVLSRAEAALAKGDTAAALAELDTLPVAGQLALQDWRDRVEARDAAISALAPLME